MVGNFILSENRNTYGGYIFASDFCTDYEGTRNIAERIVADWKFDKQCKKNISLITNNAGGDITKWK